jgi:hypothetical protein
MTRMCCKHETAVQCVRSSLPRRVSVVLVVDVEIVVVIVNSISMRDSRERYTNQWTYALTYTQSKHKRSHNNNNNNNNTCKYINTTCLYTHIGSLYLLRLVVNGAAQRARKCTYGLHSIYHNKHVLLSLSTATTASWRKRLCSLNGCYSYWEHFVLS